jgi:hypothetical protein
LEVGFVHISGKTWRASFAALAAALVLATGFGASPASADHVAVSFDNRVVNPTWCRGSNEYDRRIWLSGTFYTQRGREQVVERNLRGCYRILSNGEVQTTAGPLWILNGSLHFLDGYRHGDDIALNGVGVNKLFIIGTFEIDGVQTRLDGYYNVTSQGEIWFRNDFHRLGEWSDWYEAGVRVGYAAAQRRLDACFNRISLVDVTPRTYGPELTFEVMQYLPEVPAERVVIGFREVSEGSRQPQIVSGENALPWCVKPWFRYDTEGPRLTLDLGRYTYVLSYNEEGPYYKRYWNDIPGWEPKPVHNEDLWQRIPAMG